MDGAMSEHTASPYTLEQITEAVRAALQPVRIYDAATDNWRPVTQADVDRLSAIASAFGRISMTVKDIKGEIGVGEVGRR